MLLNWVSRAEELAALATAAAAGAVVTWEPVGAGVVPVTGGVDVAGVALEAAAVVVAKKSSYATYAPPATKSNVRRFGPLDFAITDPREIDCSSNSIEVRP